MASVKILLRKRKTRKEGYGNLVLLVTLSRKERAERSLKQESILIEHWDPVNQFVTGGHYAIDINDHIGTVKKEIDDFFCLKRRNKEQYSINEIPYVRKKEKVNCFIDHLEEYKQARIKGKKKGKIIRYNTIKSYNKVRNKLREIYGTLPFDQIDSKWVNNFDQKLVAEGKANNTVLDYMKIMKTVCRDCMNDGLIKKDPFLTYEREHIKTDREHLTIKELKRLKEIDCNSPLYYRTGF